MGRAWLGTIGANPDVELVGLVDLDVDLARRSAAETGHGEVPVATELAGLEVDADAVINVTIPQAHAGTTQDALFAGLPVLCEKPIAPDVATGLAMAAAAEASGALLMISQSRRYFNGFQQFRSVVGDLGAVGTVTCEFFKAPHFGGFRDAMEHPLLVDMAIHTFDAVRALLGSNPVSVYCDAYNPSWSWYAGDAAANASFTFAEGVRFGYHGSWCAPGQETSWNGSWRVSAERGTACWDGDHEPTAERVDGSIKVPASDQAPEQISGSLAEFVDHLRRETIPATEAASNVVSLAMVEAAVRSAEEHRPVQIADVLTQAYDLAVSTDHDQRVLAVLKSWSVLHKVGLAS
ncbi:Gfo/Idh/MocA family oxidoreductase [Microlunatus elymi]|uniref:Gfo/Idh/MocA family oxidoreductase n=2 Tax=Microlunatus elymi TaxID=2596828 RepID=A0A516Q5N7_9ACTN|nr:Gfo/Idh/MocA family oxidoreductase [Microlunatus elymi]